MPRANSHVLQPRSHNSSDGLSALAKAVTVITVNTITVMLFQHIVTKSYRIPGGFFNVFFYYYFNVWQILLLATLEIQ